MMLSETRLRQLARGCRVQPTVAGPVWTLADASRFARTLPQWALPAQRLDALFFSFLLQI